MSEEQAKYYAQKLKETYSPNDIEYYIYKFPRSFFKTDLEFMKHLAWAYKTCPSTANIEINLGYVYFIKSQSGLIKIGRSYDYKKRLKELQNMSAERLFVLHVVICANCILGEKIAHETYKMYRVHGEWFDIPDLFQKEILNIRKDGGLGS